MFETGKDTLTGGRLKRLESHLRPSGTFMLTYGDGVANVDIEQLVNFHRQHGKIATMTTVRPSARFGTMQFDGDQMMNSLKNHKMMLAGLMVVFLCLSQKFLII